MDIRFLYITCKNAEEARAIGHTLIEEKLAVCVNIFDSMHSIYRWKGDIEESDEAVLIVKTTDALSSKVEDRVRELHSYECPCIATLPLPHLNAAYHQWLLDQIR